MLDTSLQPAAMQERYKLLPKEITELFEYETVDYILEQTAAEFGLSESQKGALEMEVDLVLYFYFTREKLQERIEESLEIDAERAELVVNKLNDDLFILVEDVLAYAEELYSSDMSAMSGNSAIPPTTVEEVDLKPSIDDTPMPPAAAPIQVKPLRTFAMDVDVKRAHGYGAFQPGNSDVADEDEPIHSSNQDDILKK